MCIAASVGKGCRNGRSDVKTVQLLLNMSKGQQGMNEELEEDGILGDATLLAIGNFQRSVMGSDEPDLKVEPGGTTLMKMAESIPSFCRRVLKGVYIHADDLLLERYCAPLAEKMAACAIDTPLRMAHFLAQVGHESGELRYCEELASGDNYEGRTDLGNNRAGDGRRFKGRGLIQLTGRANYTAYGRARGIDCTSDQGARQLATDPMLSVDVACWFWTTRELNGLADRDDIVSITRRINGGLNGLDDRKEKLVRAKFFIH